MSLQAQIVGEVTYREGDGAQLEIPQGAVEVELTETDATLSWTDDDTHGSASMPLDDYRRFVDSGAIREQD